MRALLFFLGLLFMTTPAWALGDSIVEFCFTTSDPQACIKQRIADEARADAATARLHPTERVDANAALQAQLEMARLQANGLALFGSGAAMINGMNQGFQHMQVPYVSSPGASYGHSSR